MSDGERIGVFGGTFDPIHNTHIDIARTALMHARLDRVLFVVSARPPHKDGVPGASPEERMAMVVAAIEGEAVMEPCRLELDRPGPSYTCQTLAELAGLFPSAALFLVVGYDALLDLPKWRKPEAILARARLLVVPRPGERPRPSAMVDGRYELLPFKEMTLSSTEVRERIAAGEPFEHLVPPGVAQLIRERSIYDADAANGTD